VFGSYPFVPGSYKAQQVPLSRYLPPIPGGIIESWLKEQVSPGDWILDPFGASPQLVTEAARAGYRVLVAAYNPIARFLLELAADPPTESELRAALADLAISPKGEERLEPHIRSLYLTECLQCGKSVSAEAFIWKRDASVPTSRIYNCPNCMESGEFPTSESDAKRAAHFGKSSLHHARALERVAALDDPDRLHVEEALSTYLPRAVYALFTIINKLDNLPPNRHRALAALLLPVFDKANTLWQYPTERIRPRKLNVPSQFRENNIWLELENAVSLWSQNTSAKELGFCPIPITTWPELPPNSGGICLFDGRINDLVIQFLKDPLTIEIKAVSGALPRPNQAYWSLSALWAGWLWGRDEAAKIKGVLRRRRYDWAWHCTALQKAFSGLIQILGPGIPIMGIIGEAEAGFLSAAIIAAWIAGFKLLNVSLREEIGQAQLFWIRSIDQDIIKNKTGQVSDIELFSLFHQAADNYLRSCCEPVSYLRLDSSVLFSIAESHKTMIPSKIDTPSNMLARINNTFQELLFEKNGYIKYGGSEHSLDTANYWLSDEDSEKLYKNGKFVTLSDRVEIKVANYLQEHPGCSSSEIDKFACQAFPGLLTPELDLVLQCLKSYGKQKLPKSDCWILRTQDTTEVRIEDITEMKFHLEQIGIDLKYEVSRFEAEQLKLGMPLSISILPSLTWQVTGGEIKFEFFLISTAIISNIIFQFNDFRIGGLNIDEPHLQRIIVLPGGRAGLLGYKLQQDAHLRNAVEFRWQFLKFRNLRRLSENSLLTRDNLQHYLALDPLANIDPQMTFI
jgi:hypothetical protein